MTDTEKPIELESFEPQPLLERYSPRHEFPISLVASALILLGFFGLMLLAFYAINHSVPDTKPVPLQMVEGGEDDVGRRHDGERPGREPGQGV